MNWYAMDTWIVVVGALTAVACALPGSFLVLRGMSMMGDAISHAVLPGLAVAFIVSGSRVSLGMFLGAAAAGVLAAVFTQWISKLGNVEKGASMGIVFTTLFAVGLVLIVQAADHVDLDPSCVLYGAIELTPLDTVARLVVAEVDLDIPRAALVLALVCCFNAAFVILFYKELRISSFDPELAATLGFRPELMHYLLMTVVAVTTVAAFEAVGSILVIAMLIVPPAAAYLLTDRLGVMLVLASGIGVAAAVAGHAGAITVPLWFGFTDTSTSGMMAVMAGFLFVLAACFSPAHGILTRAGRTRKSSRP